jgi:hypothetical protein
MSRDDDADEKTGGGYPDVMSKPALVDEGDAHHPDRRPRGRAAFPGGAVCLSAFYEVRTQK